MRAPKTIYEQSAELYVENCKLRHIAGRLLHELQRVATISDTIEAENIVAVMTVLAQSHGIEPKGLDDEPKETSR